MNTYTHMERHSRQTDGQVEELPNNTNNGYGCPSVCHMHTQYIIWEYCWHNQPIEMAHRYNFNTTQMLSVAQSTLQHVQQHSQPVA